METYLVLRGYRRLLAMEHFLAEVVPVDYDNLPWWECSKEYLDNEDKKKKEKALDSEQS